MATSTSPPLFLSIFFFFIFSHLPNTLYASGGFSVDLIHRDSPRSPFYNPSDTLSDRITRAVRRSDSRINYFRAASSNSLTAVSSNVVPSGGEYLMAISLGTPPVKFLAIADTGSDLIWTQCNPCESCYEQDVPLFNPNSSSTYRDLDCSSQPCSSLPQSSCGGSNTCQYSYRYGDQSYTNGNLASETLTMASSVGRSTFKIPKIVFGCGHDNDGTFGSHGAGLVGLGAGPLSLISQLSSSINGKFSYCLASRDQNSSSSRMDFGDNAIVSGKGAVSTPLISKAVSTTFYFVTLLKISIADKSVSFGEANQGNIIVDSGTTLTYLPSSVYEELASAVKDSVSLSPTRDPTGNFDLCFEAGDGAELPSLKFSFEGADVNLPATNNFVLVSDNVVCFAFVASDSFSIFGNIAQQNFKIGYDLEAMKLSFKPTNCASQ